MKKEEGQKTSGPQPDTKAPCKCLVHDAGEKNVPFLWSPTGEVERRGSKGQNKLGSKGSEKWGDTKGLKKKRLPLTSCLWSPRNLLPNKYQIRITFWLGNSES